MIVSSPLVEVPNLIHGKVNVPKVVVDYPEIKNYKIEMTSSSTEVIVEFYANKALFNKLVTSDYVILKNKN